MDGGPVFLEQARFGQCVTAGTERTQGDSTLGEAPQRRQDLRGYGVAYIDATADEQNVDGAHLLQGDRGRELQAVTGRRGLTVHTDDRPVIHSLARDHVS